MAAGRCMGVDPRYTDGHGRPGSDDGCGGGDASGSLIARATASRASRCRAACQPHRRRSSRTPPQAPHVGISGRQTWPIAPCQPSDRCNAGPSHTTARHGGSSKTGRLAAGRRRHMAPELPRRRHTGPACRATHGSWLRPVEHRNRAGTYGARNGSTIATRHAAQRTHYHRPQPDRVSTC